MAKRSKKPALGDGIRVDDDGFPYLGGELLWKFRAVDAEYKNAVLAMNMKIAELDAEMSKHPDIKRLIGERESLALVMKDAIKELGNVNRQIEEEVGVQLSNCSIDDKTGRIFMLDGSVPPMKAPRADCETAKSTRRRARAHTYSRKGREVAK